MLPKKRRISSRDFKRGGRTRLAKGDSGSLRVVESSGETQLAVIVPKSKAKTAVTRNRLRRIVYDDLASQLNGVKPNLKIFYYPTIVALKLKASQRRQSLKSLLQEARVLK